MTGTIEEAPVSHGECRLHRALIEQRFGTLEKDMRDVKSDVSEMKAALADMSSKSATFQTEMRDYSVWILRIVIFVLLGVLFGRILDIDALVGIVF
jgi:hypothetical protein